MNISSNFLGLTVLLLLIVGTFGQTPLQFEEPTKSYYKQLGLGKDDSYNQEGIAPKYRLNDTFIPSHYDVELKVILDAAPEEGQQFTVPGNVKITFKPTDPVTNRVTLHSNLIQINTTSVKIRSVTGEIILLKGLSNATNEGQHFLFVDLDITTPLNEGNEYTIYIEFIAPISRDRLNGLYYSSYVDPVSGETRSLVATQMESHAFRQLVPSFDEPGLKATFNFTIIRQNKYFTLGNEEVTTQLNVPKEGWSTDKFTIPIPMSTYLFALVISDFTYVQADSSDFVKRTRVYAPPYMIQRGGANYSAQVSAKLLQYFDDHFEALYPLSKMDTVAIPDFSAGAMENWGLNLYRISLSIYYPGESLESERESVTSVLSHELAHQNFGDWVSCKWWSDLWLNEGFASYISNWGVDAVAPEFNELENRINGQVQSSMRVDIQSNSNPLRVNVVTPSDGGLSGIIYDKGASINRMMEGFLTAQTFHLGLRIYLQDMKFKAAMQEDLWRNLQKAADSNPNLVFPKNSNGSLVSMQSIMETWTLQSGHPIVRVNTVSQTAISLKQERYGEDSGTGFWYVPVPITTKANPRLPNAIPAIWLNSANEQVQHSVVNTSQWVMINYEGYGYYRVLYDDKLTDLIVAQLEVNSTVIPPLSRSQLLDDYFTLAFMGKNYTSIENAMSLTKYLIQERHFTVWEVILRQLKKPYDMYGGISSAYTAFKAYLYPKITSALLAVGVVEDEILHKGSTSFHRQRLLDWACSMDSPECYQYAQSLSTQWQDNPQVNPVPLNSQAIMHCAIIASGGQTEWNLTLGRLFSLNSSFQAPERNRLFNSISCAKTTGLVGSALNLSLDTTVGLTTGERQTLLQRLASNAVARESVMGFLELNVDNVIAQIGNGSANPVANVISSISSYLSTQEDLDRLEKFIQDNAQKLSSVDQSLQTSVSKVKINIQWMKNYGCDILLWLGDQSTCQSFKISI